MVRSILVVVSLIFIGQSGLANSPMAAEPPYQYDINPNIDGKDNAIQSIEFALHFIGDASGKTVIDLPDFWGGYAELYKNIQNLRVDSGVLENAEKPNQKIVHHKPGANIILRYSIRPGDYGPKNAKRNFNDYRPIIEKDFFHIIGNTVFAFPATAKSTDPVRVRFGPMANGMAFASDLQQIDADGMISVSAMYSSITVGGNFNVMDAGNGMRIAIRGKIATRTDADWKKAMTAISSAQNAFWKSKSSSYLVTVLTSEPDGENMPTGGTGLDDAFAFFATSNSLPADIDDTLMHEFIHSWIARRIGGISGDSEKEREGYWLSEGFTDYLKMRMLVRTGMWSDKVFVDEFNGLTARIGSSPYRATPNVEVAKKFWTDGDAQQLPYDRGALLAMLFDAEVRRATKGKKGFDDILLDMHQRARKNSKLDAIGQLKRSMTRAGVTIDRLLEKHIEQGIPISLPEDSFAPCGQLTTQPLEKWELGLSMTETVKAGIIIGLVEGSPAWRSGLRNGMNAKGWSVWSGDTQKDAEFTVEDGAGIKTYKWKPVSDTIGSRQVLKLNDNMTEEDARLCHRRIGGAVE